MKCLYCGKLIKNSSAQAECEAAWHSRCVKSFFGTKTMPLIDISEEELEILAQETVGKGYTVPGVQKSFGSFPPDQVWIYRSYFFEFLFLLLREIQICI